MSAHLPEGSHSKAKLAAEVGLGAAAAAAVIGVGLSLHNRRKALQLHEELDGNQAAIFNNKRLRPSTRQLMAQSAALLYHATMETESGVISEESLLQRLDVSPEAIKRALGHLKRAGLIALKTSPPEVEEAITGYQAEPALIQAVEIGAPSDLHQAVYELRLEG